MQAYFDHKLHRYQNQIFRNNSNEDDFPLQPESPIDCKSDNLNHKMIIFLDCKV